MLTADQRASWVRDGYLAIPGVFTGEQVDRVTAVVDGLFRDPPPWLMVDDLAMGVRTKLIDVPAADRTTEEAAP